MTQWKVSLIISGAIVLQESFNEELRKSYQANRPVMSNVQIRNIREGLSVTLDAWAVDKEEADHVAIYFIGEMLNVLTLRLKDIPLYLHSSSIKVQGSDKCIKRVVTKDEILESFNQGYEYGRKRSTFSRALSWYRKGLISEDPIDRLLAFWLSLEVIGKYAEENEKTKDKHGKPRTKNRIMDCFDQLWVESSKWKIIPDGSEWMDKVHCLRNNIAHGSKAVDIDFIKDVNSCFPRLQKLAHVFLTEWEREGRTREEKVDRESA